MKITKLLILIALLSSLLAGCVAFRSGLQGEYQGVAQKKTDNRPVNVLFHFTHLSQTRGLDAIPKVVGKNSVIMSFDNVFSDALPELENLGSFATFTDDAGDVNHPERRALLDSLIKANDYTVNIRFTQEHKFSTFFLGGCLSTVTATLFPVPYHWTYKMETSLRRNDGTVIATYSRRARLTNWVEALLLIAYPFAPQDREREEIFIEMFHDTFKQINSENVLTVS